MNKQDLTSEVRYTITQICGEWGNILISVELHIKLTQGLSMTLQCHVLAIREKRNLLSHELMIKCTIAKQTKLLR